MNIVVKHQIFEESYWHEFCNMLQETLSIYFFTCGYAHRNIKTVIECFWQKDVLLEYIRKYLVQGKEMYYFQKLREHGLLREYVNSRDYIDRFIFRGFIDA